MSPDPRRLDGKVAVIGTGSIGSMALWHLAARLGSSVVGFERTHIADDRTGLGGDSRLFRVAYKEGAVFTRLLQRSRSLWQELDRLSGREAFLPCGVLTLGDSRSDYISSLISTVESSRVEHELLQPCDLERRFPQHQLVPDDIGLFDPAGGLLRTNIAVLSAVEQAQSHGASLIPQTEVTALTPRDGVVEVHAADQSWLFEKVLLTGGAWSSVLLPERLRSQVHARRVILSWFSAKTPGDFAPDRFCAFIRESLGIHMYGAPSVDGDMVKVAGIISNSPTEDPSAVRRELSRREHQRSREAIEMFLPDLFSSCVRSDAYPDLFTTDRKPLVGWVPELPGVYTATGFSGRGFKMASGVGDAVATALIQEVTPETLKFASTDRFRGSGQAQ